MITIKSNRLRVDIAEPGEAPNTTHRFDRAGFITDVILDGSTWYCASEPGNLDHPPTGGRGLCNEYHFDVSEEAEIGGYFPKLGIGLFQKEGDEKYIRFKRYKNVKLFPVSFKAAPDSVVFTTEPEICMGYAVSRNKVVKVYDNCLQVETEVKNTGEKEMTINEYNHNFVSISGMALGPDYTLEFPTLKQTSPEKVAIEGTDGSQLTVFGDGRNFTYTQFNPQAATFRPDIPSADPGKTFSWRLSNSAAKASIEEILDFMPSRAIVWAVDHMISTEVFITFTIKPGESKKWSRLWKFNA